MAGMEGYFGPRAYRPSADDLVWTGGSPLTRPSDFDSPLGIEGQGRRRVAAFSTPPPAPPAADLAPFDPESAEIAKYVRTGVGLATLITENLLSHPFVVLRRQCQVNNKATRYHILPVTLVPVIVHLHQGQGITSLCKGIGSVLLIRGMALAVEDVISKASGWPKELDWTTQSFKDIGQHLLLKCVTLAIITPFYSASLVETVQSDIASEKPGVFDVFKEGVCRLLSWSSPQKGRMLPVWSLVLPTVVHGVAKYLFSMMVKKVTSSVMLHRSRRQHTKLGAVPKESVSRATSDDIQVTAGLVSLLVADTVFFPLETILHRLYLQGTRTIIDNLDDGYSVVAILTNYESSLDCYQKCVSLEGRLGLFKGFGALLLQFSAHAAVLRLTKYAVAQLSGLLTSRPLPPPPPPAHPSTRPSSSLRQLPSYQSSPMLSPASRSFPGPFGVN